MVALVLRPSVLRRAVFAWLLCAASAHPALAQRAAVVSGTVKDSAGRPIADVEVRVAGAGVRVFTDERGVYRMAGLVAGLATLTARRLGFKPYARDIQLVAGQEHHVDVDLVASPELLEGLQVVAAREVYDSRLAGFNARLQQKVGHFVTRERIDRANSTTLSDMLREIPGVKIGPVRNQGRAIRLRGANCPPLVFVDGFPATAGEFDVDMIDLQSVEGIEVYAGLGTIPAEFAGPRDLDRCGVIAIWSRPSRSRRRPVEPVRPAPDPTRLADASEILTRDQVDVVARLDSGTIGPHYPDSLFAAKVPGRVVVEFVVDTAGTVELATIDVLASSHPLFTLAVRASLAEAHFSPATARGRKVRQYVQLPYSFAVSERVTPPNEALTVYCDGSRDQRVGKKWNAKFPTPLLRKNGMAENIAVARRAALLAIRGLDPPTLRAGCEFHPHEFPARLCAP
jgi:TonB family protein